MNIDSSAINIVQFAAGETLFMENELSFHFFMIQSGDVEVFKTMATGRKVPLAVVSAGTAIGEFAMIDRLPRSATARALTDVTAAQISEEAYRTLLAELPEWAVSMLTVLVERLRHTNEIIRSAGIVDQRIKEQIQSVEYDPDAGTIVDENPFLRTDDDPDDPELG